ncbi:MAG: hydroxyacid dehydrogenase [Clostridia bacterium]|nr:hydroxyacid dehydrogenase [Clostridia bacterium]
MKAVFLNSKTPNANTPVYPDDIRQKLYAECDFFDEVIFTKEEDLIARAEDLAQVDYIFSTWGMPRFTEEQIKKYLPSLKAVFYGAGSVQGFAREFLNCGIDVFSAWGANAVPVAEFTVAQIILANKGYFQRFCHTSCEKWENRGFGNPFRGNYNTKVGLLGAGMIGKLVINMLKAYRLDVLVFDPFLSDEKAAELGVTKASLETIFAECDVISNHLANNPQTQGILKAEHFASMKFNATFINTGRGAQVDEAGLAAAMREVPTRVALLDVTMPEPPVEGSDFYKLPNVFLSPHIAGSFGNEVERMGEFMYEEMVAYKNGLPTKYGVTLKMLETMA